MTLLALASAGSAAAITPAALRSQLRADGACGTITGGNHAGYAGLIVILAAQPADGRGTVALQEAQPGVKVNVATYGETKSPPGNVVKLTSNAGATSSGDSHIAARYKDHDFSVNSSKPCKGQVVLTGQIGDGQWAIDCDISKRGGVGNEQPITAKGSGTPTLNGKKLGAGHWEISEHRGTPNGGHEVLITTYVENDNTGWKLTPKTTANLSQVKFDRVDLPAGPDSKPSKPSVAKPHDYYKGRNCSDYHATADKSHCNSWNSYYSRLDAYNAREAAKAHNRQAARAALSRVHFTHKVGNTSKNGKSQWVAAPASDWKARIYYRVISQATTSAWAQRYNDGSPWSVKLAKQVYRQHSRSPTSIPTTSNDVAAMLGDPHMGDRYCEQLRVNPSSSTGGGIATDSDCVSLAPQDECRSDPWNLLYDATLRQTDAAGNAVSGDLGQRVDDAWVGETYGFFYDFDNSGPADWTGNVTLSQQWGYGPYGAPGDIAPLLLAPSFAANIQNNENDGPGVWWLTGRNGSRTIQPADGGQTYSHYVAYAPAWGDDRCHTGGSGQTPTMSVYVPYYYDLTPQVSGDNLQTQQGSPVTVHPSVLSPGQINGDTSRWTTWSRPTNWTLTRTAINPDTGAGTSQTVASGNGQIFKPPPEDGGNTLNAYTDSDSYTITLPAGTKLCYTLTLQPRSSGSNDPTTSQQWCTEIVKAPKVQFWNSDVHAGRHFKTPSGDPTCGARDPNKPVANITTSGPPTGAAYRDNNLYGSWVEYGVFASGSISSFGSATTNKTGGYDPAANAPGQQLTFGNDNALGGFTYSNWCIPEYDRLAEPRHGQDVDTPKLSGNVDLSKLTGSDAYYWATAAGNVSITGLDQLAANKRLTLDLPSATSVTLDGGKVAKGVDLIIHTLGTVKINGNISYDDAGGYANAGQIPRMVLITGGLLNGEDASSQAGKKPDIVIKDDVTHVDAWLIAHGTLYTCDVDPASFTYHGKNCGKQLVTTGPVAANEVKLRRSYGSDLTKPVSQRGPAEIFDLNPGQLLSSYTTSRRDYFIDVYQRELPPRY